VSYHLPCHQGEIPQGANGQLDLEGDSSSQRVRARASDAQRNQRGEETTAHQTDKKPGSNSDLPQEAEGETDHLPETASNRLLG
jgi:hypothetical protein